MSWGQIQHYGKCGGEVPNPCREGQDNLLLYWKSSFCTSDRNSAQAGLIQTVNLLMYITPKPKGSPEPLLDSGIQKHLLDLSAFPHFSFLLS